MKHPPVLDEIVAVAKNGDTSEDLFGECPQNARRVYETLKNYGYSPNIVRGAYCRSGIEPKSISEAENQGIVHWWTTVTINGTEWTIDLSSQSPNNLMKTIITDQTPSSYVEFERNPSVKPPLDVSQSSLQEK